MEEVRLIGDMKPMAQCCRTCPFKLDDRGIYQNVELANTVIVRMLTKHHSQICHHPRHYGKPETHLCRGARNYLITLYYRLGFLEAETDEAWEAARGKG